MSNEIEKVEKQIEASKEELTPVTNVTVTNDEKERFFKCFLSDKPYTETVSLFGGKFVVVFRTMTIEENDDIFRQITIDQEKGLAANNDGYFIKITQYRLGVSIDSINGVPFLEDINSKLIEFNKIEGTSYITERAKELSSWQTFKLAGVLTAFREFEAKVLHLTNFLNDPNFWKAVA